MWEEECGGSHEQVRVWWEFSYPILKVNELRRAALASEHLFKPPLSITGKSRLETPEKAEIAQRMGGKVAGHYRSLQFQIWRGGQHFIQVLGRDFTGLRLDGILKVTWRSCPESLDRWLFSHSLNTSGYRQLSAF